MIDYEKIDELIQKHLYYRTARESYEYNRHRVVKEYNEIYPHDPLELEDLHGYVTQEELVSLAVQGLNEKATKLEKQLAKEVERAELCAKSVSVSENGKTSLAGVIPKELFNTSMLESPYDIMVENGKDPSQWRMVKYRTSQVASGNYTYSLELAPKATKDLTPQDVVGYLNQFTYRIKDVPSPKEAKTHRALEIDIADTHIGSKHFDEERYFKAIHAIKEELLGEYDIAYVCFLGDIIHVDNESEMTNRGTQLSTASGPYRMIDDAFDILINTISIIASGVNQVEVFWVQGNHARLLEYTLMQALAMSFTEIENIKFTVDERRRKAFLYGNTLVGIHHGDMPKRQKFDWLQFEFAHLWGQAKFWEMHNGHTHTEEVETRGAVVSRTVTTIKSTDDYEYNMGYTNNRQNIMTFGYDYEEGLDTIKYF